MDQTSDDNDFEICQHKHKRAGRLLLTVGVLLVFAVHRNDSLRFATISESAPKDKSSGIHQENDTTGLFFYDQLEDCIPCTEQERQELGNYVPKLMIPGFQKSGTTFMINMLRQHPDVSPFKKESHILSGDHVVQSAIIHQCQVWEDYKLLYDACFDCQEHQYHIDKTPAYLFLSHLVPSRLACAFPKPIKILILLRDPTDRAFSHYQMNLRKIKGSLTGSTDEFFSRILREHDTLQQVGVAPGLERREGFIAWKRFHHAGGPSVLSHGLYALQLAHWIDALSEFWGLSSQELVQDYFFIVDNDDVMVDPQGVLDRILEFAGLAPFQFDLELKGVGATVHNYTSLKSEERAFLDGYYQPFNVDLHHFLAPFGIEIGFAKRATEQSA